MPLVRKAGLEKDDGLHEFGGVEWYLYASESNGWPGLWSGPLLIFL